jgi:hypothetical protein
MDLNPICPVVVQTGDSQCLVSKITFELYLEKVGESGEKCGL